MQKHIKTLARRAKHLWGKLDAKPDYSGRLYDQAEYEALAWALNELGAPLDCEPPEPLDEDDAPPRLEGTWAPGATTTIKARVPSEPRGRRYYPDGDL